MNSKTEYEVHTFDVHPRRISSPVIPRQPFAAQDDGYKLARQRYSERVFHLAGHVYAMIGSAHHEEHVSGCPRPYPPDGVLLARLGGADQVLALVLHHEQPAVAQLG